MKYLVIRVDEQIDLIGSADILDKASEIMETDVEKLFYECKGKGWKVNQKLNEMSAELISAHRCLEDEWGPYKDVIDVIRWQIIEMK